MKSVLHEFNRLPKKARIMLWTVFMLAGFNTLSAQTDGTTPDLASVLVASTKPSETTGHDELAFTVSGRVTSDIGEAIPGANVLEKGTSNGTITDTDGKYSLVVADANATLSFSFIGYANQEIAVNGRGVIDVTMIEDIVALSEIIVVGYGSQKKTDLTGAISSIPAAQISQFPMARVDQALQGRSSGVYVLNTDGSPGGNTMIRIRGLNSINGGNEPLIVIDGLQGGNLNSLNPNDIASVEILKDASATAIYGSRGANGVVLITTKLGKRGKPIIDAGFNVGFQKLAHKLPVMSAADFAKTFNKYRMTDTGNGNIPTPQFTNAQISNWEQNGGTDWQDEIYETGVMQNFQLAISGATDKLKYMVSGNYLDHEGILLNSQYSRASLRTNLAADITSWVDFGVNYAFTKETYKSPSFRDEVAFVSQVVNNAPRWAPTEPVYDDQGNYWVHASGYAANDTWNPVASAVEPIIDNPTFRNNANLFLNFKIVKGLSFKVTGGALMTNTYFRDYYNRKTYSGLQNNGWGHVNESKNERYQNSNILTYDNSFNNHHLTFTGVIEQIYEEGMGSRLEGRGFLVDQLGFDNLGGASTVIPSSSHYDRSLLSYLGRVNYVLSEKYMATLTYRADASSVFGAENKWGYFPSGSVAWRLSEESFIRDLDVFTEFKLRASYGLTGNQGISPYQSLARLSSSQDLSYPYNGGSSTDIGFGIGGLANPNLKWETTTQTNIGVDFSLFNGRLTSTIDWYKKVTKDLLMPRELPGYVGVSSVLDNIGSIENKGVEILISGDPIVGDGFRWSSSVNFTMNRNKVLDLGPAKRIGYRPSTGGYSLGNDFMFLQVGEPFGLMNGWKFLGVWSTDQDAEARSYGQLPGDPHYLDLDKDGDVDTDDRTTIGNGYPKFTWGLTNQFHFKGFDLSLLMIGYQGVDLFNTMRIRRDSFWEGTSPVLLDAWTPENQDTDVPGMIDGKYREDQNLVNKVFFGNNSGATSQWVEDASFIRLKTATLAYTFGQPKLQSFGFQRIRVFMSGTNIFTFTKYTGYDPEVAAFTWSDANIGVDLSVYPPARTLTLGFELTF